MSTAVAKGSIRRRLLISLLIGAAVLAVAVYFVVLSVARQVAQESQDNILVASAMSILESARFASGHVNIDLPYSALSMLGSLSDERVFYAIRLETELLSGYADLPEAGQSTINEPRFRSVEYLGETVRVTTVRRPVSTDVRQSYLQVSVAQTLSGQAEVLARLSRLSMAVGAGVFGLSVLLAALIARSTIRPLDRLTASVSRRGPEDLRPVAAPVPSEMVPLVGSLNTLMDRLQTSLSRSEDFIAEAAHRVRTPLAIVRTKAEIIERKTHDADTRKAAREMIHAIDDSSRTAGQLLDHAMVTFRLDRLSEQKINLPPLLRESVERLRPIAELKGIDLAIGRLDQFFLHGDQILLQNALHNLLDNAIKYAPEGAQIELNLMLHHDTAEISIRDTGPGFPVAGLDKLTDRFARGENARAVVGSGLGLTIVKDVVEAHGGHVQLENTPGGGACVTLSFPLS